MNVSRDFSARIKLVSIATLAAAVLLIGPVSTASAAATRDDSAPHAAMSASAKLKVVPKVVGKTAYAAKAALSKVGLGYSYSAPKGSFVVLSKNWTVTKQSPKAGSNVRAGTRIKLSVVKTSSLHATGAAPAGPALTTSQQQAFIAAKSYLSSGIGFSDASLIDQLTSSYGNGFSVPDATAAVNALNPDWNAQAVMAAKAYMSSGIGFSHASLLDQLTSTSGNGFTPAQAAYAVGKVGL